MNVPTLAYVEHCLPGATLAERLAIARAQGLALELADAPDTPLDRILAAGFEVVTLQAFRMHELHPLHPEAGTRRAAERYVRGTLERAAAAGIPRVLTACGFGERMADRPFERCVEFYGRIAPLARERGLRVLVEPLSARRAAAMHGPADVERLLATLAQPDVFAGAIDTGHLLDGGHDPERALAAWRAPLAELQLRGADSRAPDFDLPLARWLATCASRPAVVCVEHRETIAPSALVELVAHLRRELG